METVKELVDLYKDNLKKNGLGDELFKWEVLRDFRGRPDTNAPDFFEEIKSIDFKNLVYPVGIGVVNHLAKDKPEEYRECFKILFDEEILLQERIKRFDQETLRMYRELIPDPKLSHHQDERTMATFLAYHNPERYPLYKDSFYRKYCQLIAIKPKKRGEKYVHYLELVEKFKNDFIENDQELLDLVYSKIPKESFQDENHLVLAQDILYVGLEKLSQGKEVVGLMASDGTGWQDIFVKKNSEYDALIVWNSKTPSGKQKSIKFLRGIIEEGNTFNLYYSSNNKVTYCATIKDFVCNQEEYVKREWQSKSENIYEIQPKFSDYKDSKKSASIVFLATKFEKIKPIPVSEFKFFESFSPPTQDNLAPISFEPEGIQVIPFLEETGTSLSEKQGTKSNYEGPLNQILFGPPGTGKTYNTINRALEIIGLSLEGMSRKEIKDLFDEKVNQGQIVFTTFHQSMSYEDFIEGIKPIEPEKDGDGVIYRIVPGVFKALCDSAATPNQLGFDVAYDKLIEKLGEGELLNLKTPTGKDFSVSVNSKGNLTLYTGKNKEKQGTLTKENIQKQINGEDKYIGWEGYFSGIIEYLKSKFGYSKTAGESEKKYVLIIDEINRGNVSQIFGEMITLIEDDKRLGEENEIHVTLPYSKSKFAVPRNVYILGTMNTADRSVEALDTALRRRFSFEEYLPSHEIIHEELIMWYVNRFIKDFDLPRNDLSWTSFEHDFASILIDPNSYFDLDHKDIEEAIPDKFNVNQSIEKFSNLLQQNRGEFLTIRFLEIINRRIEKLLDKDHQIGHSYFMGLKDWIGFESVFYNKILPLLQEYFFGDYGKLGLVLGDGFVRIKESEESNLFAPFIGQSDYDFSEKRIYEVVDYRKSNHGHKLKDESGEFLEYTFKQAIRLLVGNGTSK